MVDNTAASAVNPERYPPQQLEDGIRYVIPAPDIRFVRIAGPIWLVGWGAGMYGSATAMGEGFKGFFLLDTFLFLWLTAWVTTGVITLGLVLWTFFGKEVITATSRQLRVQRRVLLPGIRRNYDWQKIDDLHCQDMPTDFFSTKSSWSLLGVGKGKISFTYGKEEVSFGLGLSHEDALRVAQNLNEVGHS